MARENKRNHKQRVDRISQLPSEIKEKILEHLPLIEAVKASLFSRSWRNLWAYTPQLYLDKPFFSSFPEFTSVNRTNLDNKILDYMNIVFNILYRHIGHLRKFTLYIPGWIPKDKDVISHCFLFLSPKCVQEVTLIDESETEAARMVFEYGSNRRLHSWVFPLPGFESLCQLRQLALINFEFLSLPSDFTCMPSLISLKLHMSEPIGRGVNQAEMLRILVSKCPRIEKLDVKIYDKNHTLIIQSPTLKNLVIGGQIYTVRLEKTEKTEEVSLEASLRANWHQDVLTAVFACLSRVQKLVLGDNFWNILSKPWVTDVREKLKPFMKLRQMKQLVLDKVPFDESEYIPFFLALFQSVPNLEKMEIRVSHVPKGPYGKYELAGEDCCYFYHLKSAKLGFRLYGWPCSYLILFFAKFILGSSPALEVMTFEAEGQHKDKRDIENKISELHRVSANVKIIYN